MRRSTLLSFCAAALLGGLSLSGTALGNWFGDNSFGYYYGYSWGPGCPDGTDIEDRYDGLFTSAMTSINITYPNPMELFEGSEDKTTVSTWCKTRITLAMSAGGTVGNMNVQNNITSQIYTANDAVTVETTVDPGTLDLLGRDRVEASTRSFISSLTDHSFKEIGNIGAPSCHFYRYATFTVTTKMTLKYDPADNNDAEAALSATFLQFPSTSKKSNAVSCRPLFHTPW